MFAVAVTLGPLVGIDVLVRWVALKQGDAQLRSMAQTMVAHAENILDTASGSLDLLADEGIAACSPATIRRLGEMVFVRANVKEIGVVDEDGRMLCSNFGPALIEIDTPANDTGRSTLVGMVPTRLPGRDALALSRAGKEGALVALVEPSTVLLELLHGDQRDTCHARISLADGSTVGTSGATVESMRRIDPDILEIRVASARYPLTATVAAPKSALLGPFLTIQSYAKVGAGGLGAALLVILGAMIRRREGLEEDVEEAIRNGEFVAHYQPIVDAVSGRVAGCEALLRWEKPTGEIVRPDLFVPMVESTGQIMEITRQVMAQVRDDVGDIVAADPGFYISINLVAEHFASDAILADIGRIFRDGPISARNLVFEITERRPLPDLVAARKAVGELQRLGARVALDDAGTGHGGLAYIQALGMNMIKIDRMFVDAIGTGGVSAPIVDALLELGRQLEMSIVSEGVETEEQFAYLRASGARYFQGYLFSPALPASAFGRFVAAFNGAAAAVAADRDDGSAHGSSGQLAG